MAALVLAVVGVLIAPTFSAAAAAATVGSVIGGLVGAVIDQMFIYPALFKQADLPTGPRLDELRIQTSSYGSRVNVCWGPKCRVAGTVIYLSNLNSVTVTSSSGGGGKGGGGGVTTTAYNYYVDVGILVCEGTISDITRIWAGGNLIYNALPDIVASGTNIACVKIDAVVVDLPWYAPITTVPVKQKLTAPSGGPNLAAFISGHNATVAGFSTGANNGTFWIESSGTESDGSTWVLLKNANAVSEAAGASVTVTEPLPAFDTSKLAGITIYKGTASQSPDPILEAAYGVGAVPAFRYSAWVMFDNLYLADFGNQLPQMTFEVKAHTSITTQQVIEALLTRAGLTSARWNTSAAASLGNVQGYVLSGPVTMDAALQPLMIYRDLVARDNNDKIEFVARGSEPTVAVSTAQLAAHEGGQAPPEMLLRSDLATRDIPRRVTVRYLNPDIDMQSDVAEYQRIDYVDGDNEQAVEIPLVMSAGDAADLAQRILWYGYRDRVSIDLQLPPRFVHVLEGDVLNITGDSTLDVFVQRKTRGENGVIEVAGTVRTTQAIAITGDSGGDPFSGGSGGIYYAPDMTLVLLDIPALLDAHTTIPGYYIATCATSVNATFSGATVFESTDDSTYTSIASFGWETVICKATTALPTGPVGVWDNGSTVDVLMLNGTLASATEAEVYAGANRMYLGTELIAFRTATLIGTNKYRLSNLIRGLRNTANQVATHQISEYGTLLDSSTLQFRTLNLAACGTYRYDKCVSVGQDINAVDYTQLGFNCNSVRPFAPYAFTAARQQNGDIIYTWYRQSRSLQRLFAGTEVPNLSASEKYEIDIYNSTNRSYSGTIVRTISSTTPTATYTAAQQTADGLSLATLSDAKVYEIDTATVGRGTAAAGPNA